MPNHTDSLVGRPIVASIGEPWDFESTAGQNRLEGRVTAVSHVSEPIPWCLCTVSAFGDAQKRVKAVGIVDRYAADIRLSERLAQGERVGANFVYDPSGDELTVTALIAALANKKGMAFLAGSVQVQTPRNVCRARYQDRQRLLSGFSVSQQPCRIRVSSYLGALGFGSRRGSKSG